MTKFCWRSKCLSYSLADKLPLISRYFANKVPSQSYGFSSSHVWMWELDYKERWAPKNWCFWTVVLEKTLGSPLDCKEMQLVHPKGNQSWIFTGRTDAEAETPILWPSDVKNWLIWKDPDAEKAWGQEEKRAAEDEMVEWHHWPSGDEFEQTPGDSEGQGSLVWGRKKSNRPEWLNNDSNNPSWDLNAVKWESRREGSILRLSKPDAQFEPLGRHTWSCASPVTSAGPGYQCL